MFFYLHGGKGRWTGKVCWGKSEVIPQTLVDIQFYVWGFYIVKRYTTILDDIYESKDIWYLYLEEENSQFEIFEELPECTLWSGSMYLPCKETSKFPFFSQGSPLLGETSLDPVLVHPVLGLQHLQLLIPNYFETFPMFSYKLSLNFCNYCGFLKEIEISINLFVFFCPTNEIFHKGHYHQL